MKTTTFKNKLNSDQVVADYPYKVDTIDGVEYLIVRRPGTDRKFLMRKDALERVDKKSVARR
jgi:hypothetical protein